MAAVGERANVGTAAVGVRALVGGVRVRVGSSDGAVGREGDGLELVEPRLGNVGAVGAVVQGRVVGREV